MGSVNFGFSGGVIVLNFVVNIVVGIDLVINVVNGIGNLIFIDIGGVFILRIFWGDFDGVINML